MASKDGDETTTVLPVATIGTNTEVNNVVSSSTTIDNTTQQQMNSNNIANTTNNTSNNDNREDEIEISFFKEQQNQQKQQQPINSNSGINNTTTNTRNNTNLRSNVQNIMNTNRISLSLRELSQISPLECEAEAYILRTVEETDPTSVSNNNKNILEPELTILGNVPMDVIHNFSTTPATTTNNVRSISPNRSGRGIGLVRNTTTSSGTGAATGAATGTAGEPATMDRGLLMVPNSTGKSKRIMFHTHQHKRTYTTEENLFQLTEGLSQLQQPEYNTNNNNNNNTNTNASESGADGISLLMNSNQTTSTSDQYSNNNSGDVFAATATKVLRRRKGQQYLDSNNNNNNNIEKQQVQLETTGVITTTTTSSKVTSAKDRWKKVSAIVDSGGTSTALTPSKDKITNNDTIGGIPVNTMSSTSTPARTGSPNNKVKTDEEFGLCLDNNNTTNNNDANNTNTPGVTTATGKPNKTTAYSTGSTKYQNNNHHHHGMQRKTTVEFNQGYNDFKLWVQSKHKTIKFHFKLLLFVVTPSIGIAAILFYLFENPPCGTKEQCETIAAKKALISKINNNTTISTTNDLNEFVYADASYSWWILFIGVRHSLLLTLAAATKGIIIDFLCVRTRTLLTVTGPVITLFTVQSKGWPFLLGCWSVYSFALLYGTHSFAQHWLFFQDTIALFTDVNPSGGVTSLPAYRKVLILALAVALAVTIKRFWIGITIGRHTFARYATDLTKLMAKVLLVGQVAELARDIESYGYRLEDFQLDHDLFTKTISSEEDTVQVIDDTVVIPKPDTVGNRTTTSGSTTTGNRQQSQSQSQSQQSPAPFELGTERVFGLNKDFTGSAARNKIDQLLGEWEEPQEIHRTQGKINISSIIQFRTSLSFLNTTVPFGPAFGNATTRQDCIVSIEELFRRLLLATPDQTSVLTFDTLAMVAIDEYGNLNEDKIRELIRVFRPDREGNLTLIDFAKSIDSVYKELRLLRASVLNSSRMDHTFEGIVNVIFYFIMYCIILSVLGLEPLVLFASVSGFILAFAFMIGAACSKYFEGIIFILIRRPYDIGDRVNISDPTKETEITGSPTWYIRDVNLFSTTMCFAATNEVATYSNGSLAACRIINAARSPNAVVQFNLKFPIDVSYEKLQVFKRALEEFVKARPREYLSFSGFRCTRIEADLGYVQYIVLANHRESWQNLRSILVSKAELASFALELSKKMHLRYKSPPMPIDLRMSPSSMKSFYSSNSMLNDAVDHNVTEVPDEDNPGLPNEQDMAELKAMFAQK